MDCKEPPTVPLPTTGFEMGHYQQAHHCPLLALI